MSQLLDELRRLVATKGLESTDNSNRKEENETKEPDKPKAGEEKAEVKTLPKESKEVCVLYKMVFHLCICEFVQDAQIAANAFLEQLALRKLTGGVNTDLGVVWYEIQ